MNILIAPDKFKHSLSSIEACHAIRDGLQKVSDKFSIKMLPLADGGDGLSDVVQYYHSAGLLPVEVHDPLMRRIQSAILVSADGQTAFIEMAKASGLMLLKENEYNCRHTSTFGTGELIKKALGLEVKTIIIGIGGSATNDCGIGMAAALGFRFFDEHGKLLEPCGDVLGSIACIDTTLSTDLAGVQIRIACDVDNPLFGPQGAARIYAAQKGATPEDIEHLEKGMQHFAGIIEKDLGKNVSDIAGSGAAGGLGAGCIAFLDARLSSGIELVLLMSNAEEHVRKADLVITGEGKIDAQSLRGKVISGIGNLCKAYNKPLVAFCGKLELTEQQVLKTNIRKAFCINRDIISIEEAYKKAYQSLTDSTCRFAQTLI